jgi:hypothetical protein
MAFPWWNSQAEYSTDPRDPPLCASPIQANVILSRLCPYLHGLLPETTDPAQYWDAVLHLVQRFVHDPVPHPLTAFPAFVEILHHCRSLFSPRTVGDCLQLLQQSNCADASSFFVYECPKFLVDPLVHFDALLCLKNSDSDVWRDFSMNLSLVDAFFELHGNNIQPVPSSRALSAWRYRVGLAELLFSLIRSSATAFPRSLSWVLKFLDFIIPIVGAAPLEIAAVCLRYVIRLMRGMQSQAVKNLLQGRALRLLNTLDGADSPLFLIGLNFLLALRPSVVSGGRVIRMISTRGVRSLTDIETVSNLADGSTLISAISCLAKSALASKLWHRACVDQITVMLLRFPGRGDVREFLSVLSRRLFVFVAVSAARNKYRSRALRVCESLASLLSVKLLWLQQTILTGAASILATRAFPVYFKCFFPSTAPVDDTLVHEYEAFSNTELYLKTFPFDPVKGSVIAPPMWEPVGQRVVAVAPKVERCSNQGSVTDVTIKKCTIQKKAEPIVTRPGGLKQPRPLASAICLPPVHRR